jgi:hypothetical protein
MVCHAPSYPSIHRSLGLPLLRVPSGSHSKTFSGSLFPAILFTCPNHRSRFSSVTSKMFFRTSMTSLMATFRTYNNNNNNNDDDDDGNKIFPWLIDMYFVKLTWKLNNNFNNKQQEL